jgi:type II secretory pathway pseudopilin PulG
MGIELILAVMIFCIGAGAAYVIMEYRAFGERESAQKRLNAVQNTLNAVKKDLSGYTKYTEYLIPAKNVLLDKRKSMNAKVFRELSYVENIPKDPPRIKNIITIAVKYTAEFVFELDLKPENFDIVLTNTGIQIQVNKPTLVGLPVTTITSTEIPLKDTIEDEKPYVNDIKNKLPPIAYAYGPLLAMEECVRAYSEKKMIECLRDYLMAQTGVKKVPVISVSFK